MPLIRTAPFMPVSLPRQEDGCPSARWPSGGLERQTREGASLPPSLLDSSQENHSPWQQDGAEGPSDVEFRASTLPAGSEGSAGRQATHRASPRRRVYHATWKWLFFACYTKMTGYVPQGMSLNTATGQKRISTATLSAAQPTPTALGPQVYPAGASGSGGSETVSQP